MEPGYHYYWQGSLMQLTCKSPNSKKIEHVECKPFSEREPLLKNSIVKQCLNLEVSKIPW